MKTFISYSTPDTEIVRQLSEQILNHSEVFFWDENKVLGENAWHTIFEWIDNADLVIVVITDNTVHRAMSVGQEVGRALTKGKTIIPMVSKNVPSTELGCLNGITFQAIDVWNPTPAIQQVAQVAHNKKLSMIENQKMIISVLVIGALILFLSDN